MTGPKKPRAAKTAAKPAAKLTTDQLRLVQYFAAMSDEVHAPILAMMAEMAESCPRRVRPALRLVSGGTS